MKIPNFTSSINSKSETRSSNNSKSETRSSNLKNSLSRSQSNSSTQSNNVSKDQISVRGLLKNEPLSSKSFNKENIINLLEKVILSYSSKNLDHAIQTIKGIKCLEKSYWSKYPQLEITLELNNKSKVIYFGETYNEANKTNCYGELAFSSNFLSPSMFGYTMVGSQKILKFQNGTVYEGPFVNSKANGKGTLTYKNGDKYEGEFVDGMPTKEKTDQINKVNLALNKFIYNNLILYTPKTSKFKEYFSNFKEFRDNFLNSLDDLSVINFSNNQPESLKDMVNTKILIVKIIKEYLIYKPLSTFEEIIKCLKESPSLNILDHISLIKNVRACIFANQIITHNIIKAHLNSSPACSLDDIKKTFSYDYCDKKNIETIFNKVNTETKFNEVNLHNIMEKSLEKKPACSLNDIKKALSSEYFDYLGKKNIEEIFKEVKINKIIKEICDRKNIETIKKALSSEYSDYLGKKNIETGLLPTIPDSLTSLKKSISTLLHSLRLTLSSNKVRIIKMLMPVFTSKIRAQKLLKYALWTPLWQIRILTESIL